MLARIILLLVLFRQPKHSNFKVASVQQGLFRSLISDTYSLSYPVFPKNSIKFVKEGSRVTRRIAKAYRLSMMAVPSFKPSWLTHLPSLLARRRKMNPT